MAKARRWANPTVFPRSNDAPPGCHSAGVRERPETHLGLDVAAENADPARGVAVHRSDVHQTARSGVRLVVGCSSAAYLLLSFSQSSPWSSEAQSAGRRRRPALVPLRPRARRSQTPRLPQSPPTGNVDRRRVRWGRSIRFQPGAGSDSSRHADAASRDAGDGSARAAEGAGRDDAPSRPALQGETRKEEGGRPHQSGGEEAVGEAGGDLPAESASREPGSPGGWSRFGLGPVRRRHPADRVPSATRGRVARLGRLAPAALSVVGMAVQTSVLLGGLRGSRRRPNRAPTTARGPGPRRLCRRQSGERREACGSGHAYWYVNRRDPVSVTSSR